MIRPETLGDHAAIHEVNRLAFGEEGEARLIAALRDGGYVRVSLVAEEAGRVVGHILFSDLSIVTPQGVVEALSLAPLAVVPDCQRQGIGSALVREGLRACTEAGHRIVLVVGHPEFYPRFDFTAQSAERLLSPYAGPAFMALELAPGALEGVEGEVRYPPPFGDL
ncbi:putative acetyltransferase [Singulisphaera acidiphila DSM 18658]|uniref:Putative acetyltransferase n=1 Tax=Singulisphaera acidiphila (strain ATCC BAA-1392 / DSM 18658 / VKM B-2454 / MOB10) TaxID=886293 RepID=L0DGP1_SINAD|nr:putative acetyltransferase [Singulisphaera acidiphila DSM 18658]